MEQKPVRLDGLAAAALAERQRLADLPAPDLAAWQLQRLNRMLAAILPANQFYRERLGKDSLQLKGLDELAGLPFTTKSDLNGTDHQHHLPVNLTWPVEHYVRYHRTSGTQGQPLVVLDTADDWTWWLATWQYVLDAAGIGKGDRCFLAFGFGPFIGFWSAFDAIVARGGLAIPSGGLSSRARIDLLQSSAATAMFCTPSYALHLGGVAVEAGVDPAKCGIRRIVVAGEPGGSVPATRQRIESVWRAEVTDHGGASEVGPWGVGDRQGRGLHVIESEFIAEFIAVDSGRPASDGELAELVLTSLGRWGAPLIRYRTGDLVRPRFAGHGDRQFVFLEGGVLGRADQMLVVRGVNVFPSALEQILHGFPEIVEYRATVWRDGQLDQLRIEVEDRLGRPERVEQELRLRLGLRTEVVSVPPGSLPRSEGKSRRFVDQR
jgi:phenylacetate-CoA ligase